MRIITRIIAITGAALLLALALAACGTPEPTGGAAPTAVAPTDAPATPTAQPTAAASDATASPTLQPTAPAAASPTAQPTMEASTIMPDGTPIQGGRRIPDGTAIAPPYPRALEWLLGLVRADAAQRGGADAASVEVVEVRSVIWPNPGLGCPQPGVGYQQVPVDGLFIRLRVAGQSYDYHSAGPAASDALVFCGSDGTPGELLVDPLPGGGADT